ncbi:MAG: response regulator transcription factor [Desulfomonile tiedjei]|uniref:Response regulator transcription factor n=1 Tax=Desulfomonile tiedjei TaxID=2358 RepID=A0A9D6V3W6_9BACT|nr:response regulator transcription factor [Desulfomonile tiedjei]
MGLDVTDRKLASEKHTQYVEKLETTLKESTERKHSYGSGSENRKRTFSLTKREIQILRLVAEGLSNNEISLNLAISPHTVKTHVTHILDKVGVTDRTQASVLATRLGII